MTAVTLRSPVERKYRPLGAALLIFGAVIVLLGLYNFLMGDMQWDKLAPQAASIKAIYKESLSTGVAMNFIDSIQYYLMKFSMVFLLIGLLLLLNGYMMVCQRWERFKDFMCIMPAIFFLALFVYYPLLDLVRISFTNWNLLKDDYAFVGLKNYKWLFDGTGLKYLKNSLSITALYTFWEVAFALIGGILLAMLFNRMTRYFNALRALVFMPKYIATSTSAIVFIWILNGPYGILNYVLKLFGIIGPNWLGSSETALTGILILTLWRVVGYSMMIYLSAMKGIPQEYYEAASIDGADGMNRFRFITMPLLAPTTIFLLVTTFISSMKVFQSVDVMTGGGPYDSTMVMVQWIYKLSFEDFRVDRAAVGSIVFFVILLLFTSLTMRYSNRNVNYDA